MISVYRSKINENLNALKTAKANASSLVEEIEQLNKDKSELNEMLAISRKAAGIVQDKLGSRLATIVTKALKIVLQKDLEFVIEFVERRGVSEADLYVRDSEGHEYDILDSRGGGLADVVSLALQLAFILISDTSRYLIVDELARHLSVDMQERFAAVLKNLCKEFNFTVIAVTHAPAFVEVADRIFEVTLNDEGRSEINEKRVHT